MAKKTERFWFVWNPMGSAPRVPHASLVEAESEARRLAGLHPGQNFVVLKSVSAFAAAQPVVAGKPPRECVTMRDDLPF